MTVSPVKGSRDSNVAPPAASTHSPPMNCRPSEAPVCVFSCCSSIVSSFVGGFQIDPIKLFGLAKRHPG